MQDAATAAAYGVQLGLDIPPIPSAAHATEIASLTGIWHTSGLGNHQGGLQPCHREYVMRALISTHTTQPPKQHPHGILQRLPSILARRPLVWQAPHGVLLQGDAMMSVERGHHV